MSERRDPRTQREKEGREITSEEDLNIQAFVFLWIIPAAVVMSLAVMLAASLR
jgi:hypothetical protein